MLKKMEVEQERCTGCRLCETVCSLSHEGKMNLTVSRIQIAPLFESRYHPRVCLQCQKCPPSEACPTDAFQWDKETRVVRIIEEQCDGCGLCVSECQFSAVFEKDGRILVCDVCDGSPRCVEVCEKGAVIFA